MTTFRTRLAAELAQAARPDVKAGAERYFLGATRFLGVKNPAVRALTKAHVKRDPPKRPVSEALALLRSPLFEMRLAGVTLLEMNKRALPDDMVASLAPIFDDHVTEWATCDALCGAALRTMVTRGPRTRRQVVAWSRAASSWRQRASAVAFVNEARHGMFNDDVIRVCTRIVRNPDRFVQLGCGWALRELSLADRPRVLAFIDDNARFLSREGLRYATEKMPKALRIEVHARHARLRA